jgi:hypothetical protein
MAGELLLVNPRKRKTTKRKTNPIANASNQRRKISTKRRRRNPINLKGVAKKIDMKNIIQDSLKPAVIAAGGALSLDLLMGFLPIPQKLKTGPMRHVIKGAGAIGLGLIAGMIVKPQTAKILATGALTVTMYDAARGMMQKAAPKFAARAGWGSMSGVGYYDDELGYYSPAYNVSNDYDGVGYYDEDDEAQQNIQMPRCPSTAAAAARMGMSFEEELDL